MSWFGKLSSDINFEDDNKWIFISITSIPIVSITITIIVHLFFHK
ncbi:DUF2905 family protein [Methylobacter sp. S3L5C]|nr:DUF2905 family protein [Methylobacter sp. S3L5C]